jgi:hypothetical protein
MFISDIQTTKRLWSNEQQQRDQTIKTAVSGKHKIHNRKDILSDLTFDISEIILEPKSVVILELK